MFTKTLPINIKIRKLTFNIFNRIENNGNCTFENNGEKLFLKNLVDFFANDNETKTFFDIGANIGNYSSTILDHARSTPISLHVFEPTHDCYNKLSIRFKENKEIILNNIGVSDQNTKARIYYDKEESGLASLYKRNLKSYSLELEKSEDIKLRRLDDYIEDKKIEHVHFIKIDIEGHELSALKGLGNYLNPDFIDFLQFEYGGANLDSHTSLMDLYQLFTEKGFSIAKILPKGLELREYSPYMDNFQYSNYVAISNKVLNDFFYI